MLILWQWAVTYGDYHIKHSRMRRELKKLKVHCDLQPTINTPDQLPFFLISPSGVCKVPSLLMSMGISRLDLPG